MRRILRWALPIACVLSLIVGILSAQQPTQSPENLFQAFLADLRTDMETLADRVFGGGTRPDGWIGNLDFTSESMLADLWFDHELLGDEVFGAGARPRDWVGASTRNADLVARNVRHDLELAANEFLGEGFRPDEWIGGPLLYTCERSLMNAIYLLNTEFNISPDTPETVLVYCRTVQAEVEDVLVGEAVGEGGELTNVPSLVLAVRGDLERLADEVLGVNNRPLGWIRNTDIASPTLAGDIFSDLEALADIILGAGTRPGDWIGTTQGTESGTFRNLRHDLELLTDISLGVGLRPNGWQGDSQIFRCEPLLQSLVFLSERVYDYSIPETGAIGREFCDQVSASVNFLIENPPAPPEGAEAAELDELFSAESQNAFGYLDPAAIQYMGVVPRGTLFRAWYRNFGESSMMFVSGENFALFIDRRWTTMSDESFRALPTLDGVRPLAFCDASWCNGPGPTPTPTGSGPILDIINANTPPALAPIGTPGGDVSTKQLVSWNNIRVNYLLQRTDVGRVQVTLEICTEASQIVCEPVLSVLDNASFSTVPIISQFNGLNVFELPYGYSTNFTIEGTTLYSQDIWLNDPTLTGN